MPEKSVRDRFAIVGLGMIVGPNETYVPGHTARLMETEAARLAIEDAGLSREDINGYLHVHGGPRSGDGSSEPTDAPPRVLGLPINFYLRGGRGGACGSFGIATCFSYLEYGLADYIVVSISKDAWSKQQKAREAGFKGHQSAKPADGSFGVPLGQSVAVSEHSLLATRHMARYGSTSAEFAAVAVAFRQWANLNPLARMYRKPMSIEDHQASPVMVWPYHRADMAVTNDGAIALVVTTAERAKNTRKPIYVKGVGFDDGARDLWWQGPDNYEHLPNKVAKEKAYAHAGITNADLDMVQFYDCFTGEVVLQLEDYGFAERGGGARFAAEGHLGPGGSLPTNTSGGLLSGYHFNDMTGISESILQLRGEAGERQLRDPKLSLVTGHGGELLSPGLLSTHSTLILGTPQ